MQEENPHLTAEQARHLTVHGVNQNEDGTYSWKFDNYVRAWPPYDMRGPRHPAPVVADRRAPPCSSTAPRAGPATPPTMAAPRHFQPRHASSASSGAGHWLHHDRLDEFLRIVRGFLSSRR